ncbi:MAG: histidine kinase dimerization/phosphoacceptor domain -containing protein [Pseudomonadota bacterium]
MKTRKISNKVIIAIIAVLAIVTIFIYLSYLCHRDFEETAISQTQGQLLTIAKTTANRLEEFIDDLSRDLRVIAAEPAVQEEIKNRIMQTQLHVCPIKIFYESHKDNADTLTTLDANGIMLHRHPFWVDEKDRIGTDFNDKPGVAYVLREHVSYVSEVFYNYLGELAISISEPVFHENEFIGMVRWMISLDNLSKHFIQPIKAGKAGFAWLLDEGGTMLSYPDPTQVGKHIMVPGKEKFPGHDWSALEEIVKKSTQGEEDTGTYGCATCGKRIIAYAPVHIGNQLWSIGVSMNYSEIATPIFEHAMHHVEITALVMLLFSAGGFAFYRMERKRSAELENKNIELMQEIAERKHAEDALKASEGKLTGIVDSVTDFMFMVGEQFNIMWTNDVANDIFGPDMVGKKCHAVYHGRDKVCESCIVRQCFEDGKVHEFETEMTTSDGNQRSFWCTASVAARHDDGRPRMVVESLRDITERKQAEEKIRTSLREKEVLLREIHHRVKNNMQVISSLLKLQSKYIKDEKDVEMFRESQNRIKSMALVHEKLYQSQDLANIDFNEYVKHLANILFRSYGIDTEKIALKLDIEDVIIEVDIAIPCGLIVNELVSNSLKYAFTEDGKGEVKITLHSTDENEMELTVSDDGVGVPKDLDFRNTESLGLKLVNILTNQIRGRLDLERSKGSKFYIRFKR